MTLCTKRVPVGPDDYPCQGEEGHDNGCVAQLATGPLPPLPPTDLDLYLTDDELTMLKACTSEQEWNAACRQVKAQRTGGRFPNDWYARVIVSGLMRDVMATWGKTPALTITDGAGDDLIVPVGPQSKEDDR